MIIAGAGLAGLIAGHMFPHATIIERAPCPPAAAHQALLRFRSEAVSLVTGVPFRKVRVHKGIWDRGALRAPSVALSNQYALKVVRRVVDRSIWNLDTVERYVAPHDLWKRLLDACRSRIVWGVAAQSYAAERESGEPLISTMPMPAAIDAWLPSYAQERCLNLIKFGRAPIHVKRARIPGADVFQTLYFPSGDYSTYRASITGDRLIIESMLGEGPPLQVSDVLEAFGLGGSPWVQLDDISETEQSFGKIEPIDDATRRDIIFQLTQQAEVYSVGRFATWRNILLDDVVNDLRVVKSMIEGRHDSYQRRLHQHR